jgi:CRISPR/Cas system-associated exonuclease Cas4 (RecB family)
MSYWTKTISWRRLVTNDNWEVATFKKSLHQKGSLRVLPLVESAIVSKSLARNAHRDTDHLHPSDLSKTNWCLRSTYYKVKDVEESDPSPPTFRRLNIFEEGHYIHDKWQKWLWDAGVLVGEFGCKACPNVWWAKAPGHCPECYSDKLYYREVPVTDDEHMLMGKADGIIDDGTEAVLEIKSIGLGTIRWDAPNLYAGYEDESLNLDGLWKAIKRPLLPHLRQLNLYMYCLGIHDGIVIYEFKPTQEVKEFHVKYNENLIADVLDDAKQLVTSIKADVLPPRHKDAKNKSCAVCKFCPYKSTCWSKS